MTRLLLLIASMLAGCVPMTSSPMRDGVETSPPPGWVDYCVRNPADPSC